MKKKVTFNQTSKVMTVEETTTCVHYLTRILEVAIPLYHNKPTYPNKALTTYEAITQACKQLNVIPTNQLLELIKPNLIKATTSPIFTLRNFSLKVKLNGDN